MIFIAAGTQKFPFDRLFRLMDELAAAAPEEALFAQTGYALYEPVRYPCARFLDREAFDAKMDSCDLLITHGGAATIVGGLKRGKPVIVVPRLAAYEEHVDDHQLQIAQAFEAQNLVTLYREGDDIRALMDQARARRYAAYHSGRETALSCVRSFLAGMEA